MPPLESQLVSVPIRKGVDTKTNAKLVMAPSLLALENGIFTEAETIKKRNGYVPLAKTIFGGSTVLSTAEALAIFDNELLLFSGAELYSYASSQSKWADRGAVPALTAKSRSILRNTFNQSTPDSATLNGVTVYVWVDGRGGVRASVVDDATGAFLISDVSLNATAVRPRAVAVQNSIVVVYQNASNIIARSIDTTNPTAFGAEQILAADGNATPATQHVEVCASLFGTAAGTGFGAAFFAYNSNATSTKVGYVRADGSLGQTSNGFPNVVAIAEASDKGLALVLEPASGSVYIVYANGTALQGVRVAARFSDLTQRVAPTSVEAAVVTAQNVTAAFDSSSNLQVFYEVNAALPYNTFVKNATVSLAGAVTAGPAVFKRSVGLAAKAFLQATGVYVIVVHDPSTASANGLQNTYFVVRSDGVIAAKLQPSTADKLQSGQLSTVLTRGAKSFSWLAPVRTQFVTAGNTMYSLVGVSAIALTFGGAAFRSAQLGESLLVAGGFVGCYDGYSLVENGFHLYPENITFTQTATGGFMSNGTYQFFFVWEWTDAAGQMHRSAPSVAISVTLTGGTATQRATFTVPTLRMTAKTGTRTAPQLVCYSTQNALTVAYKTPNGAATDPVASPVYNDPTVDTITFERQAADASIGSNQILYTQGGVLNNIAPPASSIIAVSKNRAFVAGLEDVRRIWYSKNFVRTEGVAFAAELYFDFDPSGGDLTAMRWMDNNLVLLKQYQIEVITGDGPDDLGQGSTFTPPAVVTTDVGCVDKQSVATTPDGIVFKSSKGIYLLTRALEAKYIGAPVEAYNGNHVLAATLVEDSNQVRFLLDDGVTALVWDYFFNEWSVFTRHGGIDAVVWAQTNRYLYMQADGTLMQETPGVFTDNGVDIHMRMKTAWIKLAGLQGFQRVRRATFLGDYYSGHTFLVRIAYDYQPFSIDQKVWIPGTVLQAPTFGSDATFGASSPFGGNSTDLVNQFQIHLARQKCEAIQFEVQDIGSGPGQAYSLAEIALEVGLLRGSMRLPPAKSL